MDTTKTLDFIQIYLDWIKHNSSQVKVGDYEEITTPFLDSHNDHIQFYVTRTQTGYMLTDDGYTISDLEICGCDVKSPKRSVMITQFAESLGVSVRNGSIITEATDTDIARKQHIMIQAILKISDMFLTSSSHIKGLFLEEVRSFFEEYDIRNSPSVMFMGQSGLSHQFDFVIPASKRMPERVITTLNMPAKQNIQAAIFAWNDVIKTRSRESKGYIFLNDSKKSVGKDLLAAISKYNIVPVQWKQRFSYIEELTA